MTRRTSSMPAALARQLRAEFEALPPSHARWKQLEVGYAFLKTLGMANELYGAKKCAQAIGASESSVYGWLNRSIRGSGARWPQQEELRELRRAWAVVQGLRRSGHYVMRSTVEFERVHTALAKLLTTYSIDVLAAALQVKKQKLVKFTELPEESLEDKEELAEMVRLLLKIKTTGRRSALFAGPGTAAMREAVQQAARRVSTVKIAHRLNLSVDDVNALIGREATG